MVYRNSLAPTSEQTIAGMPRGAFPWWLTHHLPENKILLVVENEEDVMSMAEDIQALYRLPKEIFPERKIHVGAFVLDDEPLRLVSLYEWAFGENKILVTSKEGLNCSVDPKAEFRKKAYKLKPGITINRSAFEDVLTRAGYSRAERVETIGEYAIRGDVIDIFVPGDVRSVDKGGASVQWGEEGTPVRITWNFDTAEAIRVIEASTQRSSDYVAELRIHPISTAAQEKLTSYIDSDVSVIYFSPLADSDQNFSYQAAPGFSGHIDMLREQLKKWNEDDWKVVVFCHNHGERDRLDELLNDPVTRAAGKKPAWMPLFVVGELEHGFIDPESRFALLANSEIFGRYRKRVRLPRYEGAGPLGSPLDIRPNDYLVHEKHGVGRYLGLRTLKVSKMASEYLALEYKGGDKLYVPIFEIQQVQKYLGAEGKKPQLSSLDTAAWDRVREKVKEDVAKLAADLLKKAAKRSVRPGHAFPPSTKLEQEFAESFIYKLTPDQKKTLEEVEADMMTAKAMDRLVCGDVGYGKTEIAMRAALKCALSGRQVALLCPTTILAEQHFRNFSERLADYPVTVQLLSRFQDKHDQKKIIESLGKGGIDIMIGTHRLLSSDIHFPAMGLLIIDEEHRFGVKQKSKLLNLRETVDVLSLTATPIPRTLASSMAGIKDLSVIETPPEGRLPISTHVGIFNEDLMVKAVQSELDRGGQVFYVHNRVKTLQARKTWLEGLLPSVRISMVHGQMKEEELEDAMHGFVNKKIDVLLATTIIESGLDIPSVNTLIIEEAEEMGLSQLYQLRGRVGRSKTKAYCYLFYDNASLSSDAKKRLEALKEFTALGSGIRLAMRDMEIRGAGNLLGPQQHGNIAAVGIETYGKLLNEEIQKMRGEEVDSHPNGPLLELSISAYIPDDYLPSESERVVMYKRILSADKESLNKIKEEIVDRCGPLPEPVKTLIDAAALRLLAKKYGIAEVHQESDGILIYFKNNFKLSEKSFQLLLAQPEDSMQLIPGKPEGVRVYFKDENEDSLNTLGEFIRLTFL
ncbi:MAG: transcription-repair coupling factor [Elusimicrobiota bacterium]